MAAQKIILLDLAWSWNIGLQHYYWGSQSSWSQHFGSLPILPPANARLLFPNMQRELSLIFRLERHPVSAVLTLNIVLSAFIELVAVFVEIIATGLEWLWTISPSAENTPRMHLSMNYIPSNTSRVRFSTISNKVRTHWCTMRMNNGAMPFTSTTSWLAALNCRELIDVMDSFQPGGTESLLTNWVPRPYWVDLSLLVRRLT